MDFSLFFMFSPSRLVNPALVTPDRFGMLPGGATLGKNARRNLTLITKLLQNLSNGVEFGKKEPYMTPMNSFINNNQKRMNEYLTKVANVSLQATRKLLDWLSNLHPCAFRI